MTILQKLRHLFFGCDHKKTDEMSAGLFNQDVPIYRCCCGDEICFSHLNLGSICYKCGEAHRGCACFREE